MNYRRGWPEGLSGRGLFPGPYSDSSKGKPFHHALFWLGLAAGLLACNASLAAVAIGAPEGTDGASSAAIDLASEAEQELLHFNPSVVAESESNLHKPALCISKEIACYLGANSLGEEFGGSFGKMAFGVQGDTQNPGFCYRITVTNCGLTTLTNIKVLDDRFADLTPNLFPGPAGSLEPGAAVTLTFKTQLNVITIPGAGAVVTNGVRATACCARTGKIVAAEDSAVADIASAALAAEQAFSVDGGAVTNCLRLAAGSGPHVLVIHAIIRNTGSADALDVKVNGFAPNACPITTRSFSVPAGTNFIVAVCTNTAFSFDTPISPLVVSASQYAHSGRIQSCSTDLAGQPILSRAEAPGCIQIQAVNTGPIRLGGNQVGHPLNSADPRPGTSGRAEETAQSAAKPAQATPQQ